MNIAKQLKSKTVRFQLLTIAGAVAAYVAANPALIAAYGPGAMAAVAIVNIVLRNITTQPIDDK